MIIYQIKSNIGVTKTILLADKPAIADFSTDQGKVESFLRSLKKCIFKPGDVVRRHGSRIKGTIEDVIYDVKNIEWHRKGYPLFIKIKWSDNSISLHHPTQITRK